MVGETTTDGRGDRRWRPITRCGTVGWPLLLWSQKNKNSSVPLPNCVAGRSSAYGFCHHKTLMKRPSARAGEEGSAGKRGFEEREGKMG
jgi:hypothetical protein